MQEARSGAGTVWAIALAAVAFRLLLFLGLDLYADEAYYWMWSRRPAAGYFDHPPMVAWLIRVSTTVLQGELGVRFLFLACGGLAVWIAAGIARELSDDPRAPVLAALLTAASPVLALTGGLALPDAPVVAAYAGGTWLVARARGKGWLAAGVVVGLALLSKYTAALLAPALLLLVLLDPELRRELRTPWPWLGGAVAVLLFLPNLLWNAQHGWIAVLFQIRHGLGSEFTVQKALEFVGGLWGGAGIVALPLGVARLLRGRGSAAVRVAAATLVPLAVTAWSATRGPVEANWAALSYPAICAAAAVALAGYRPAWRRGLAVASVAVTLLAGAFVGWQIRYPTLVPTDSEMVKRFQGWRRYAAAARESVARACAGIGAPAGCDPADPFVFPDSYQVAAQLAYYGGWTRFGPASERPSQLDLWARAPRPGEPVVTVGVIPEAKRLFRASGPSAAVSEAIPLRGVLLHEVRVEAFRSFEAEVPRRGTDLPYLKDAYPR